MEKDTNVIIRINSDLKSNLTNLAKENGFSLSQLVTAMLLDIDSRKNIPINLYKYLPRKVSKKDNITIAIIKKCLDEIIAKGKYKIKRAYLFGSFARGEEKSSSDIDIRIEADDGFTLFDQSNFRLDLKERLNREIDIVSALPADLDSRFYSSIKKDQICIYDQR